MRNLAAEQMYTVTLIQRSKGKHNQFVVRFCPRSPHIYWALRFCLDVLNGHYGPVLHVADIAWSADETDKTDRGA